MARKSPKARSASSSKKATKRPASAKQPTKAGSAKAKRSAPKGSRPAAKQLAAAKTKSKPKPKAGVKAKAAPRSRTAAKPKTAAKPRTALKPKAAKPGTQAKTKASAAKPKAAAAKALKRVAFDAQALAGIKGRLSEERQELLAQLRDMESAAFSAPGEAAGEGGIDDDYADAGSATFEREKDLSIVNNIQDLVDKIDKAMGKIADGSYGLCESCGQPISADRLKALPHVLLCIKCKMAEERR